jgi:hypothetical protein
MKKITWEQMIAITDKVEPMTKKDCKECIKWATQEIVEYKQFIKACKKKLYETTR